MTTLGILIFAIKGRTTREMNISGIYPLYGFKKEDNSKQGKQKGNEGFKEVLEKEMEKENEGSKVLQVQSNDSTR